MHVYVCMHVYVHFHLCVCTLDNGRENVGCCFLHNLHGQLSCRHHYKHQWRRRCTRVHRCRRAFVDVCDAREEVAQCFTTPGGCNGHEVQAGQSCWPQLLLYSCWLADSSLKFFKTKVPGQRANGIDDRYWWRTVATTNADAQALAQQLQFLTRAFVCGCSSHASFRLRHGAKGEKFFLR